jgi:hypothetical protein
LGKSIRRRIVVGVVAALVAAVGMTGSAYASTRGSSCWYTGSCVSVGGYLKSNGTYVNPYFRSSPGYGNPYLPKLPSPYGYSSRSYRYSPYSYSYSYNLW